MRGSVVVCLLMASVTACSSDRAAVTADASTSAGGSSGAPGNGGAAGKGGSAGSAGAAGTGAGGAAAGGSAGSGPLHDSGAGGKGDAGPLEPSDVLGTWVLALSPGDKAHVLRAFANAPALTGISVRVGWDALVDANGAFDPTALDYWSKIAKHARADGSPTRLAVRFIAGIHTPFDEFPDLASSKIHPDPPGDAGADAASDAGYPADFIPRPCLPGGLPNIVFERHYLELMKALDAWANANDVSIVHLAWYGYRWSEMYTGDTALESCGDVPYGPGRKGTPASQSKLVAAYNHLFDVALEQARADGVRIEYPLSGQGGVVSYADQVALHIRDEIHADGGALYGSVFVQSQAWGLHGSNGIPLKAQYWNGIGIAHGFQAAQVDTCAGDGGPATRWKDMYCAVRNDGGLYTEVYLPSFFCSDRSSQELASEISLFADRRAVTDCGDAGR